MTSNLPENADTRREIREALNNNGAPIAAHAKEDEPGYLARTRKATMAGAVALAGTLSVSAVSVTQDGAVTTGELVTYGIVALGIAASAWFATWAVPNA
jgi:hypothetical protein